MSDHHTVWVDAERCTGCGDCVELCPVEAIYLVANTARVTSETCTGCELCIDSCPEHAIQAVFQGELVRAQTLPAPAVRQPTPLANTAGVAIAAAGVGLFARAAQALGRALGPLLTQRATSTPPASLKTANSVPAADLATGQGRRARHRRRGC